MGLAFGGGEVKVGTVDWGCGPFHQTAKTLKPRPLRVMISSEVVLGHGNGCYTINSASVTTLPAI